MDWDKWRQSERLVRVGVIKEGMTPTPVSAPAPLMTNTSVTGRARVPAGCHDRNREKMLYWGQAVTEAERGWGRRPGIAGVASALLIGQSRTQRRHYALDPPVKGPSPLPPAWTGKFKPTCQAPGTGHSIAPGVTCRIWTQSQLVNALKKFQKWKIFVSSTEESCKSIYQLLSHKINSSNNG